MEIPGNGAGKDQFLLRPIAGPDSELYSRMEFELDCRLEEAEKIGVGFTVPSIKVAPSAPRNCEELDLELVGQGQ